MKTLGQPGLIREALYFGGSYKLTRQLITGFNKHDFRNQIESSDFDKMWHRHNSLLIKLRKRYTSVRDMAQSILLFNGERCKEAGILHGLA